MDKKDVSNEQFISVAEAAKTLGYSRQHVLRLINADKIEARKVGRSFVVDRDSIGGVYKGMTSTEKKEIDEAVEKIFDEYGEAIKALAKE